MVGNDNDHWEIIKLILSDERQQHITSMRNGLVTNEWLVSFTDKEIVNFAVGQPVIVSIRSRKIQLNQFDNISMVHKRIH